jgi:glutaredoxin 3
LDNGPDNDAITDAVPWHRLYASAITVEFSMSSVVMFATRYCPYCIRARRLLTRKGIAFEEIAVDRDRAQRQVMIQRSSRTTVPQIFIGDHHVGGYDDMVRLDDEGRLDALLEQAGVSPGAPA